MPLTRRGFCLSAAAAAAPLPARAQAGPVLLGPKPVPLPPELGRGEALGFGGLVPGPLLRVKHGAELAATLVNTLAEPIALHWQGVRIVNALDGAAPLTQTPVAPGARQEIRFVPPDPGLYCYRPSFAPTAPGQLDRGLTGLLIVDEPAPPPVDHDAVAILDDWRIGEDGALAGAPEPAAARGPGWIGSRVTLNGRPIPDTLTGRPGARVRLRLYNAANARLFVLSFVGVTPSVLAIDGQPCDPFEPVRQTVPVGPGARFDIAFDLPAAGVEAALIARGATPPGLPALPDAPVLKLVAAGDPVPARPPTTLPLNPVLPPMIRLQDARRMDLVIEGGAPQPAGMGQALAMGYTPPPAPGAKPPPPWKFNGRIGESLPDKPLFTVKRGTPVSLGFVNRTAFPQTLHAHGHVMRLLHPLDDGWEPYWRDSVIVPEGKTSRIAFLADNPGRWLIASTSPERQAAGLAAWFEVG